jgi:hypothetical protein
MTLLALATGSSSTAAAPQATVTVAKLSDARFGFQDCTAPLSQHAVFRLTRTDTNGTLDVSISTSGDAISGEDYVSPGATVTFPDGASTVDVSLDGAPSQAFLVPARTRTVTLTVDTGAGYTPGVPASADASITYYVPTCEPATVTSDPGNFFQVIPPGALPAPLVMKTLPVGATFYSFTGRYPYPDVPASWVPPPGLGWVLEVPPTGQFTWTWNFNNPPKTPVTIPIGAYSFDIGPCAYYRQIAIYYGPVNDTYLGLAMRCTIYKFNLTVEAAGTRLPAFTG